MRIFIILLPFIIVSCLINPHELGFRTDTFTPEDLPSMVVWLDSSRYTTVRDGPGNNANLPTFTGATRYWDDVSGSANLHNFYQDSSTRRPIFDPVTGFFSFDGANDYFTVTNHTDLNTGDVEQRNLTVVFKSSTDITSRQMVYDEGGGTRGMNIYLFNDDLYCGFWNNADDGDGLQAWIGVNTPAETNKVYFVSWVFDYTNYTGPAGPDGTLKCFVNGIQIGSTLSSTSKLYAHSGAIALGAAAGGTRYENNSTASGAYLLGNIMEVMIFNDPPSSDDIVDIHRYLSFKWED
jgi:hypothetical protein